MSTIEIVNLEPELHKLTQRILRRVANELAVVQFQQVGDAFDRGGQPSKKWAPLWAATFVGEISSKLKDKVEKAGHKLGQAVGKLDHVSFLENLSVFSSKAKIAQLKRGIATAQKGVDKAIAKAESGRATSYRKGGEPLSDNGILRASFHNVEKSVTADGCTVAIASGVKYAAYHQEGFHTNGPNFIPLTLNARRLHVTGTNPKLEGLEEGVDYIMAWAGVHIPARPMIDYTDPVNEKQIEDTIASAIAAA